MKKLPFIVICLIFVIDISAIVLFLRANHAEQIPTTLISSIALGFSYYAYEFSREKFRLDLLNRRWEIYEQVLKFCSVVITHGGLPKHGDNESINRSVISGLEAAHESFRGLGLHKAQSLFGPEVYEKFEQLNKIYAWFVARPKPKDWIKEEHRYLEEILNTVENLPKIFKPYVYFGDYKDSWGSEH